jgi:hypothetical protein
MEDIFNIIKRIRAESPRLKCRDLKATADAYICK